MTSLALMDRVGSPTERRVLDLTRQFVGSWKRTLDDAVNLGEALQQLKVELGHGGLLPWIEHHFPLGERMARNLMDLAKNRQEIADLPPGTTVTAALTWLSEKRRQRRVPRPLPLAGSVEPSQEPALRFMLDVDTAEVVAAILRLDFPSAQTAIDSTYGNGLFWDGQQTLTVTGHDIDPGRAPDGVMDFRQLDYDDGAADVVCYDPPHMADSSQDSVLGLRFGSYTADDLEQAVRQGAAEAWRVSSLGCIIRVADTVHGQRFVRMSGWIFAELGEPFEVVYQVRSHGFEDPKWELPQLSAHNNGSAYLVFKHGSQRHAR